MKDINQRRDKRTNCVVPVDGKKGCLFDLTYTTDLSKGGIGLVSSRAIPVNEEIAIQMDIEENGDPVFVVGKVKWVQPIIDSENYRLGIAFDSIMHGSRSRLNKFFHK